MAHPTVRELVYRGARSTSDDCLLAHTKLRPNLKIRGKAHQASRWVWIIAHGEPGDLHVLHTCHNDHCVNIQHLYLGDQKRNTQDMLDAGRCRPGCMPAESNPAAKITEQQAQEIRERYTPGLNQTNPGNAQALAAEYGVHSSQIRRIARNMAW